MKLYTPPEMSKKLVELGCKSQSGMIWFGHRDWPLDQYNLEIYEKYCPPLGRIELISTHNRSVCSGETFIPAFEFEDFAGPHKLAKKNCELRWPGGKLLYSSEPESPFISIAEDKREELFNCSNWVEEVGRGLV